MESSENPLCEVLSGTERGLYNILFSSTLPEVLESSSRGWWRAEVYNYRWIKKKQKSNTKEHKKERKYGTGSSNKKILSYIGQYLSHKLYVTLPDGLNSPLLGYFRWPYRIADSLVKQFLLCPFIFKNLNNSQLNDLEIWIINTIKKKKKLDSFYGLLGSFTFMDASRVWLWQYHPDINCFYNSFQSMEGSDLHNRAGYFPWRLVLGRLSYSFEWQVLISGRHRTECRISSQQCKVY